MSATFSADGPWGGGWAAYHQKAHERQGRERRGHDRHDGGHGHDRHAERHHDARGHRGHRGAPPFLDWFASSTGEGADRRHQGPPFDFGDFGGFGKAFADLGRGFGGPRGPRGSRGSRGPRAGRGDVRAGILILLAEEPRNGYQIIQELGHRSGGVWRPSPGSVYPALSQLEDEGLVEQVSGEGESRRKFRLTEEGTSYVESHQEELKAPWEAMSGSVRGGMFELRDLLGQTAFAAIQVARAGTDAQVAAAKTLLDDTRRGLYRILADGDITPNESGEDETEQDEAE